LIFCNTYHSTKEILINGKIFGVYRFAIESIMQRKRSDVPRKPRVNCDAIFQHYFGLLSSHSQNEKNVKDTIVVSDGLKTENKLKKLKLKFGGVTHTIHTKPSSDARNPKVIITCHLICLVN